MGSYKKELECYKAELKLCAKHPIEVVKDVDWIEWVVNHIIEGDKDIEHTHAKYNCDYIMCEKTKDGRQILNVLGCLSYWEDVNGVQTIVGTHKWCKRRFDVTEIADKLCYGCDEYPMTLGQTIQPCMWIDASYSGRFRCYKAK